MWIVDSKSDKVFRYAGAATRTSGSQSAASSFSLNSGNRSPKGIVTDGSYFWIIDSNTSDKVFKYTIGGSLVGSWTIDAANSSPTGLTIDPTGASQSIWIVDSGTDKVYEYTDALGKTSGSLSAANTFSLAAGITNPQGIADPPAPVATPAVLVIAMQLETKSSDAERDPVGLSDSVPQAFDVQKRVAYQERVVDSVIREMSKPGDSVSEDSEDPSIELDAMLDLLARDLAVI